jgi:hypothetical protein
MTTNTEADVLALRKRARNACVIIDQAVGKAYGNIIRDLLAALSHPVAEGWRPIDTDRKDGTVIQRWHATFKAPISVRWVPDEKAFKWRGQSLNWMEASYAHAWPDEAFTPHWAPLPAAPAQREDR